jgi:hypothetical protein
MISLVALNNGLSPFVVVGPVLQHMYESRLRGLISNNIDYVAMAVDTVVRGTNGRALNGNKARATSF